MKRVLCLLMLLGLCASAALAQIYTGVSASGAIVLSSNPDEIASLLLIAAPPPVPVQPLAVANSIAAINIPADYVPFIHEASQTYTLPAELIHALIVVESNYNPRALSPKGAQGLMQLMPATARRFGIDNSWDPRQNILAGSRYLRWLLNYFDGDLELSLAAYNAGEGAVVKAGRKIPRFTETEKYVPRVLSIYEKNKKMT